MSDNIRFISRASALAGLFFLLAGCATQPSGQAASFQVDLSEIEKLAAADYEKGNWLESEKYYTILVERDPDKSLNWLRLANIYAMSNRSDAAVIAYREAVRHDPELANAWYNLGVLQLRQAAHSFNEMQIHVEPEDPLTEQGQKILEGIMQLIQGTLD